MARLVLVEDEFIVATDIQSRLSSTGYDIVCVVATGEEAIARAGELRPDVVLMDVVLKGGMDGIEAAQQIIERFDIPIIFLTAHTDAATVKRATATASYGFLVKPFDTLELSAAIEMAIHRHGMEAKARESDRRIRELTESLSEMIFETDMAGNITFINRAGLKEFGYTREQVEGGMTLYDFIPPDKHEEIRESIAQAVADEPSEWIEVSGLRRDGSTFPVSVRASLVVREGVPVGIRGIALNVTEQKRAEQQLEEGERRFRELADALPEVIFETDLKGIVTFANTTTFTRYGYTKGEIEGKMNLLDVVAPSDRERALETISQRMQGKDQGWGEYTLVKKDGSTVPFAVRTMPIVRNGLYEGLRGIGIDITERKRAEQKTEESERHIRELTDTLPVVVYEADETSRVTFVNTTIFDLFGYTKEELEAGMSILQVVTDADAVRARTMFRRRMGDRDIGRMEYTGRRKDGSTFPISVRGAPIKRDGAVVGVRGIIVDITERKQADARVEEHIHTIETLNRIMTEGTRAINVQSFAKTVTDLTLELLHFDVGTIHLNDYDARRANLCYATGIPDIAVEAIRDLPVDDATYARVLAEGGPLFVDGHEALRVPHAAELGLKSFAVVPLYRYDKRIGALNVGSFARHTFSQAEKELLSAIGNEAGVVIAKLQADEALKESERRIREITDALPVVVYETDAAGLLTFANATAFDLFDYTKEELEAGMSIFQLIDDADQKRARAVFRRRMGGEDVGRIEYTGRRKDGSTFPIAIRSTLMKHDAAVIGQRGVILDVTELKRAEDEIKASLKERETLLKEIHHRVKNNMQIISSLLSLQAGKATEPETIETLNESQRQIRSMALIHEKLYRSGSLAEIDFGDYVKSLVGELLRMYNVPVGAVKITVEIEDIQLGVDSAIPCALIINELVSNSLKHAFPNGRTGNVTVALRRANGTHTLTVADDGVGFPADVDFEATDSLGMQLVVTLVNQLEGSIDLTREIGTAFVISFHVD